MSRLLRAGLFRLRRSKIYAAAVAIVSLTCVYMHIDAYKASNSPDVFDVMLDSYFFNTIIIMGVVTAICISIFVGNEYSNGSIRNKLVVGSPRASVYFSNLLNVMAAGSVMVLVIYAIGVCLGIPLLGATQRSLTEMIFLAAEGIFLVLAYCSIFHMIAMISSSKTNTAIINILLAFALLFLAIMIYDVLMQPEYIQHLVTEDREMILETVKNSNYLSGTKRDIYQVILDILPSGQSLQLGRQSAQSAGKMILYSLGITAVTTTIGVTLFCRKDIK